MRRGHTRRGSQVHILIHRAPLRRQRRLQADDGLLQGTKDKGAGLSNQPGYQYWYHAAQEASRDDDEGSNDGLCNEQSSPVSWPNIVVITIVIKAAENTNPDKAEVNSGLKESQVTRNPAPQQKERYQVPTQSQAYTNWATKQRHQQ